MKEYFYKKEYKYMYLSIFFYNFANALIETFGTVMLYKAGLPIYLILLIYGIRFFITGLITPLFVTISNKIGDNLEKVYETSIQTSIYCKKIQRG